jgi:kynureninase
VSVHDDLLSRRPDYPILETSTYLINNSLGAMPRAVRDRLAEYADLWATKGVVSWYEDWLPEMRRVADLVGAVVGAEPGSTVLLQNVAVAMSAVVSSVDFAGPRNRIVYGALDWPGTHYLFGGLTRLGAEPVIVPSDDGLTVAAQRFVDAIDERTALVSMSYVLFKSSAIVDIDPVIARAHEVGALVVVDAYQGAGAVPLDVVAQDVDVCVGGSVKWLCGGPGNGWLSVRPHIAETLRPVHSAWFSHRQPFDFAWSEIDYAPGVDRFTGGTPNVPAAYAGAPGYQAILDVGVDRIRERSISLTQPLLESALERGLLVRSPHDPAARGGHVTVSTGSDDEDMRIHDELIERRFIVDARPGAGLRIAPHFFNTAEECNAVLDQISELRDAGPR